MSNPKADELSSPLPSSLTTLTYTSFPSPPPSSPPSSSSPPHSSSSSSSSPQSLSSPCPPPEHLINYLQALYFTAKTNLATELDKAYGANTLKTALHRAVIKNVINIADDYDAANAASDAAADDDDDDDGEKHTQRLRENLAKVFPPTMLTGEIEALEGLWESCNDKWAKSLEKVEEEEEGEEIDELEREMQLVDPEGWERLCDEEGIF